MKNKIDLNISDSCDLITLIDILQDYHDKIKAENPDIENIIFYTDAGHNNASFYIGYDLPDKEIIKTKEQIKIEKEKKKLKELINKYGSDITKL